MGEQHVKPQIEQIERLQKHLITSSLKAKSMVPYDILLAEDGMFPIEL